MRKAFFLGLTALGLALASGQEAKAWTNFKFSAGVNWQWQSGDNCLLWGLFRNGQVPGPEAFQHYGYPPHGSTFPFFGAAPAAPAATTPTNANPSSTSVPAQQTGWYGGNPYYTTGYTPYNPTYAYPTDYGFGAGYYGGYYYPSYWYGR